MTKQDKAQLFGDIINRQVIQPRNEIHLKLKEVALSATSAVKLLINNISYHNYHNKDLLNNSKVVVIISKGFSHYMRMLERLQELNPLKSYLISSTIDRRDYSQQDYFITTEPALLELIELFKRAPWIKKELGRMKRWILCNDEEHQLKHPWIQKKNELYPKQKIQIIEVIPPQCLVLIHMIYILLC